MGVKGEFRPISRSQFFKRRRANTLNFNFCSYLVLLKSYSYLLYSFHLLGVKHCKIRVTRTFFLFTSETLRSLDKDSLKSSCVNLETTLMKDKQSDIDANDLFVELKFLQNFMPKENIGPVEILNFLKRHDCFPNASIAYRVLLTIPVTVASAERSFFKLKLLKSYMRSTMTQQSLNDLATIALESEVLEKIDYEDIIEDFISKNTKRMKFFK